MKRIVLILTGILGLAGVSHAGMFEQGAVNFSTDTRTVVVSSGTGNPTKILSRDSYVYSTWLINNTSFFVFLSTTSTVNTSTSFSLPPCTTSNCPAWSPDGPTVPYWGQMYAVILGTSSTSTGNTMSILRTK